MKNNIQKAFIILFSFIAITSKLALSNPVRAIDGDITNVNGSKTFNYTGDIQSIVLAPGKYKLEAYGAGSGSCTFEYKSHYDKDDHDRRNSTATSQGGSGGYTSSILNLQEKTKFGIFVGGMGKSYNENDSYVYNGAGGWNGGANGSSGGGGGGASDITIWKDGLTSWNSSLHFNNRILVAGGAGGATGGGYYQTSETRHSEYYDPLMQEGTRGGGKISDWGGSKERESGGSARPGTQTSGGGFGYSSSASSYSGGGGGGWYSGYSGNSGVAGAGGSSYVLTELSYKPNGYNVDKKFYMNPKTVTMQKGTNSGNGRVVITMLSVTPEKEDIHKPDLNYVNDSKTFNYTGAMQIVTLKPGRYKFDLYGGAGGSCTFKYETSYDHDDDWWDRHEYSTYTAGRGYGGYSSAIITLKKQQTLAVYVGGAGQDYIFSDGESFNCAGGWNGGSNGSYGGGGGGATDIALWNDNLKEYNWDNSEHLYNRIIVAGGGGGGFGKGEYQVRESSRGVKYYDPYYKSGGNGGGRNGSIGRFTGAGTSSDTLGGTQSSGSTFGSTASSASYGGGAGGGWYSGYSGNNHSAGAGGSAYILSDISYKPANYNVSDDYIADYYSINFSSGSNSGDGYARITMLGPDTADRTKGDIVNVNDSIDYNYTGAMQLVTLGPGRYNLETWGAGGGDITYYYEYDYDRRDHEHNYRDVVSYGGSGGYTSSIIELKELTKLAIYVGGEGENYNSHDVGTYNGRPGWNGGAKGSHGGGGGGATDISIFKKGMYEGEWNTDLHRNSRIIVAGGGGGAHAYGNYEYDESTNHRYYNPYTVNGASGGGRIGSIGFGSGYRGNTEVQPGKQASGETFGGQSSSASYGGGGGGGWYTGSSGKNYNAGAGGSSFVFTNYSYKPGDFNVDEKYGADFQTMKLQNGSNSGNGRAKITKLPPREHDLSEGDLININDSKTFNYNGAMQIITLGRGRYKLETWGASGGGTSFQYMYNHDYDNGDSNYTSTSASGGNGGYTSGIIELRGLTTFAIYVGGHGTSYNSSSKSENGDGGWNGGGDSSYGGGGGGGATDIALWEHGMYDHEWDTDLHKNNRILVAGGGGGASGNGTYWKDQDSRGEDVYYDPYIKSGASGGGFVGEPGKATGSGSLTYSKPGAQDNGSTFGSKPSSASNGGGGGGGWYSGYSGYSGVAGAGGSAYALTKYSYKPSTYRVGKKFYMENETIKTSLGSNSGHGKVVVTKIGHDEGETILGQIKQKNGSIDYGYTGSMQIVTLGPGKYRMEAWGAGGGGSAFQYMRKSGRGKRYYTIGSTSGGSGGYASGYIELKELTDLAIYVGGKGHDYHSLEKGENNGAGGWNGGAPASGQGGGGGGASDITIYDSKLSYDKWDSSQHLNNRILVAAGGGGGIANGTYHSDSSRHYSYYSHYSAGGASGGGTTGSSGYGSGNGVSSSSHSTPGTQNSGASFGSYYTTASTAGGGGAGWYSGYNGSSNISGAGGSSYVLTKNSYKPSYYHVNEKYYFDTSGISNSTGSGNSGGGRVKITLLTEPVRKEMTEGIYERLYFEHKYNDIFLPIDSLDKENVISITFDNEFKEDLNTIQISQNENIKSMPFFNGDWFLDEKCTIPLTTDTIFNASTKIYSKNISTAASIAKYKKYFREMAKNIKKFNNNKEISPLINVVTDGNYKLKLIIDNSLAEMNFYDFLASGLTDELVKIKDTDFFKAYYKYDFQYEMLDDAILNSDIMKQSIIKALNADQDYTPTNSATLLKDVNNRKIMTVFEVQDNEQLLFAFSIQIMVQSPSQEQGHIQFIQAEGRPNVAAIDLPIGTTLTKQNLPQLTHGEWQYNGKPAIGLQVKGDMFLKEVFEKGTLKINFKTANNRPAPNPISLPYGTKLAVNNLPRLQGSIWQYNGKPAIGLQIGTTEGIPVKGEITLIERINTETVKVDFFNAYNDKYYGYVLVPKGYIFEASMLPKEVEDGKWFSNGQNPIGMAITKNTTVVFSKVGNGRNTVNVNVSGRDGYVSKTLVLPIGSELTQQILPNPDPALLTGKFKKWITNDKQRENPCDQPLYRDITIRMLYDGEF